MIYLIIMKIRKSVGAFVVNKNGEFLLLKTQGEGEIYWDIMKGGVERGEKHIDALKRELKEELGTDKFDKIKKLNLKFSFEFSDEVKVKLGYRRQNVELFLVHLVDNEILFHLSCPIGGVKLMLNNQLLSSVIPLIDKNVYDSCIKYNIEKMLYVSTACAYPTFLQTENYGDYSLREEDAFIFGAKPESLYGWGKVYGEFLGQTYHKESGLKVSIVRPFNVYGPRENFELDKSHVIPSLIRRAVYKESPFHVWGTGEQSRSFLYVTDAVKGMINAVENTSNAIPINIGAMERIKIKDLALKILKITGHDTNLSFDISEPTGVFTRAPDISRARKLIKWEPTVGLDEGLKLTVDWFRNETTMNK